MNDLGCLKCFYGARCQFSTHGFTLSLDAILGFHIQPHINIKNQPIAVKISIGVSTAMILVGLINGVLSLITFQSKTILDFGCGLYLLGSSITTLLVFLIWPFKFWILLLTQIGFISNQMFLNVQCIIVDFLLRISLIMDQWLNACVAIDRTVAVLKGSQFDQSISKKFAKRIISILLLCIIATTIHDPINRSLIDDENEDEKRIWCILKYSPRLKTYDSIMNLLHFTVPFLINFISALCIIIITARQRLHIRRNISFQENLYRQIRKHYNLLLAPFVLVIVAFPRFILSLVSGCMNSTRDAWLFLLGYFVSFIPPMLTFIIFVMPSTVYKKEFVKCMRRYRKLTFSCMNRLIYRKVS